jgi:hypothetical protein
MGPGLLTLGAVPLDVSCQVKSFKVSAAEKVKSTDPIPMLCGEDLETPDTVSLDWKAEGTILQDLGAAGVVTYSWTNAMDDVAFTFVPSTSTDRAVTGTLRLVPITVGGDAGTLPDSPVTWMIVGTPVLGDATP